MEDDFLAQFEDLVVPAKAKTSGIEYLTFSGLLDPPLQLQTDQGQCGGQLWPAGMALAEFILREKLSAVQGKRMLVCHLRELHTDFRIELGAGSGLVGCEVLHACAG